MQAAPSVRRQLPERDAGAAGEDRHDRLADQHHEGAGRQGRLLLLAGIAFGHVYAARDDGVVFAFDRKSVKIAWSFPTGGYV